jgi:hypothetical protein
MMASSDCELRLSTLRRCPAEGGAAVDAEELVPNGSMTVTLARVQELEAELAAKTEQIENLQGRQVCVRRWPF